MGPVGAIIMSFFAAVFCVGALWNDPTVSHAWLLLPIAISASIMVQAFRLLKDAPSPDDAESKRIGRVIMWSSIAEGIGIFLAVNICANVHADARLWPAIALVVGLHFLPMAYRIPFRRFYVLSAGLIGVAIIGMLIPAAFAARVGGIGGAVGLWTASIWAVRRV
jgi:hypothetical protein